MYEVTEFSSINKKTTTAVSSSVDDYYGGMTHGGGAKYIHVAAVAPIEPQYILYFWNLYKNSMPILKNPIKTMGPHLEVTGKSLVYSQDQTTY